MVRSTPRPLYLQGKSPWYLLYIGGWMRLRAGQYTGNSTNAKSCQWTWSWASSIHILSSQSISVSFIITFSSHFPLSLRSSCLCVCVCVWGGAIQFPTQSVPGALFLGVKRPVLVADHSPPSIAEAKNVWSYTSTPPIRLHGMVLS
jgi:hypothetical protein